MPTVTRRCRLRAFCCLKAMSIPCAVNRPLDGPWRGLPKTTTPPKRPRAAPAFTGTAQGAQKRVSTQPNPYGWHPWMYAYTHRPVAGAQASAVHLLPSLQTIPFDSQAPFQQVPAVVQGLPSAQPTPFEAATCLHVPFVHAAMVQGWPSSAQSACTLHSRSLPNGAELAAYTGTGSFRVAVVPSPIAPYVFRPQHSTEPSPCSAQVWLSPTASATTPPTPATGDASDELEVPPSPSSLWP